MRFGLHLSIAKGLARTLASAWEVGCETFQIFSGNPRGWRLSVWKDEDTAVFREGCCVDGFHPVFLHTPYLVNLASPDDRVRQNSLTAVADALAKAFRVGAECVVTHIGGHRGAGREAGLARLTQALGQLLGEAPESVALALEGGCGERGALGSIFEEMARILERLPRYGARLGICLDTAHLWGLGYDLSSPEGVAATFQEFARVVGLEYLFVLHLNDSLKNRGSHDDEHAIPGRGHIGTEGFRTLVNLPELKDMACIVEEAGAGPGEIRRNLEELRSMVLE